MNLKIISNKERIRQTLNECASLSEKYGLSKMTMEEITNEVGSVRKTKKINSKK